MTHHSSRKQFFAKLIGAAAAASVAPQLVAKPLVAPASGEKQPSHTPAFTVKTDARAVARGADRL